ncbi:MAG TPA: hypothetical protein VGK10_10885 [Prolixibacteraceae bacterium]|jgi:hypothetical protein
MKTLFANKETKKFNNFSFDVLTSSELSLIKGGKEEDVYLPPTRIAPLTLTISSTTTTSTTTTTTRSKK